MAYPPDLSTPWTKVSYLAKKVWSREVEAWLFPTMYCHPKGSRKLAISACHPCQGEEADQDGIVSTISVGFGVLPECSGESDHLGFGTCCSDSVDRCLCGGSPASSACLRDNAGLGSLPLGGIEVMGLVHDT